MTIPLLAGKPAPAELLVDLSRFEHEYFERWSDLDDPQQRVSFGTSGDEFELPGIRVLQFAFDADSANPHLPDTYTPNAVVFPGTHDNPTTCGWFEDLPDRQRRNPCKHIEFPEGGGRKAALALMNSAWSSRAALAMTPLQDLLPLGKEARMNVAGLAQSNWRWRCTEELLGSSAFRWLGKLTITTSRSSNQTL